MSSGDFKLINDIINSNDDSSYNSNFNLMIDKNNYVSILPDEKKVLTKLLDDLITTALIPFVHDYLEPELILTKTQKRSERFGKLILQQSSMINNRRNGITRDLVSISKYEVHAFNESEILKINTDFYLIISTSYFLHDKSHRIDGPAITSIDRDYHIQFTAEKYYQHGKLHRIDGPTIKQSNNEEWYFNGKLHREQSKLILNDSASQNKDQKSWYIHGKLHRENASALIEYEHKNYLYGLLYDEN